MSNLFMQSLDIFNLDGAHFYLVRLDNDQSISFSQASGNVTLETVHKIGQTGVTYISSGALTHSVKALDISLKIDTELALEVGRRTKRA
uniref:Nicotinate-nucleotide pyrophosphorylase carboxylatingic isoform X3 n=1 Tax=Rhizophora mucronata TaxID=61149 RepID=A0A2P2ITF3_RHIMU